MAGQWHYERGGQQHGPVTGAELKGLAAAGTLLPTALVWKDGMGKWVPALSLKGLFPAGGVATANPVPTILTPAATPRPGPPPLPDGDEDDRSQAKARPSRRTLLIAGGSVAGLLGIIVLGVVVLGRGDRSEEKRKNGAVALGRGDRSEERRKNGAVSLGGEGHDNEVADRSEMLLTVDKLREEMLLDPTATQRKYGGKSLTFQGSVLFANVGSEGAVRCVVLGTRQKDAFAYFPQKDWRVISNACEVKAQNIIFRCKSFVPYKTDGPLQFEGCELVRVEDVSEGGVGGDKFGTKDLLKRLVVGLSKQDAVNVFGRQPDVKTPLGRGEAWLYYVSTSEAIFVTFDTQGKLLTAHKQGREK